MVRRSKKSADKRAFVGIEPGLAFANTNYINVDREEINQRRQIVEWIVLKIIRFMRKESSTFNYLYANIFGGGSCYENLKVNSPDEFDIDVLLKIPEVTSPVLLENNIPGYVNLQLETFHDLKEENEEVYNEMRTFIDEKNYLLTKEMKGSFMQSIFDRTVRNNFPNNLIEIWGNYFQISRVQSLGPAFTLTITGANFCVSVDLVPCILLNEKHWPKGAFKSNPYIKPNDFFIVPKSPKRELPHIERYWRLSFQKQERKMIFDKQWMKPTIRIFKRIRDHFGHKVSSYALKTIFMLQLEVDNPDLDDEIPELWLAPLSYCFVYMLHIYIIYLGRGKIPYFWNEKLNLLDNLTDQQKAHYQKDIENMLEDIKEDPTPETVLDYLR